jgi:hypothetical protein
LEANSIVTHQTARFLDAGQAYAQPRRVSPYNEELRASARYLAREAKKERVSPKNVEPVARIQSQLAAN